jgi:CRP-like cAMP-binding protein
MYDKLWKWMRMHGLTISPEDEKVFINHTHHASIPKNTIMMAQGKPVERLYFLNDGIARLFRLHKEVDVTIDFISWNECVSTAIYLQSQSPSTCALEAQTDVDVLYWELEDFKYLKEHTKLASQMETVLTHLLLHWSQNREMDMLTMTPEDRYTKLMHIQPCVIREVPLKHIASYLGIHQDSLSRIRNKLSKR